MDEPDTTLALTTIYQWVIVLTAGTPAESASWQILSCCLLCRGNELTLNLLELKEFIVVHRFDVGMFEPSFINLHRVFNDGNFLNSELNPSELDDVPLLQIVINLLVVVFQTTGLVSTIYITYLLTTKYICSFSYLDILVIFLSINCSSFLLVGDASPAPIPFSTIDSM